MKLRILCLAYAATIAYGNVVLGKTELVLIAEKLGAPFTDEARQRIENELWGSDRAPQSSDVVIFNLAEKEFHLIDNDCKLGIYSSDLFPQTTIPEGKSSVYGIESNELEKGVECLTKYKSEDGSWFEMIVENPYVGSNVIMGESSDDLSIHPTLGEGDNNQMRFVVRKIF